MITVLYQNNVKLIWDKQSAISGINKMHKNEYQNLKSMMNLYKECNGIEQQVNRKNYNIAKNPSN